MLPAKWSATPTGQKIQNELQKFKSKNADLREKAKDSISPAVATIASTAGAVAHGLAEVYSGEHAAKYEAASGIGAIIYGSFAGVPEAVAAGNGMLSPLISAFVVRSLTNRD